MMRRLLLAAIPLCVWLGAALASEPAHVTIDCDDIRNAIATLQASASISRAQSERIIAAMARSHGVSDAVINEVRRKCRLR